MILFNSKKYSFLIRLLFIGNNLIIRAISILQRCPCRSIQIIFIEMNFSQTETEFHLSISDTNRDLESSDPIDSVCLMESCLYFILTIQSLTFGSVYYISKELPHLAPIPFLSEELYSCNFVY